MPSPNVSPSEADLSAPGPTAAPIDVDVAVIGAGFGGLAAALALAEGGARVALVEALHYPGGCAATFSKGGARFEAGATLFAGLGEEQLLGRWIARRGMAVDVVRHDPILDFRSPDLRLTVPADRGAFVEALCALPGAPQRELRAFFGWQRGVADTLWSTLEDPTLLPPWSAGMLARHALRLPAYAPLLRWAGRPLSAVLAAYGLDRFAPIVTYLRGLCQITLQCGPEEAEAPFALGAMDYYWRGCGHVRGGIGRLAEAFVKAIQDLNGQVFLACRAQAIRQVGGGWEVEARGRTIRCGRVVANLLPGDLAKLTGADLSPRLQKLQREVEGGWGAVMLYRRLAGGEARGEARGEANKTGAPHIEIVQDAAAPFTEGNHIFLSVLEEAQVGGAPCRTLTASTHVDAAKLAKLPKPEQAALVQAIQDRMRAGIARFAPECAPDPSLAQAEYPGSPRTFARFTRRGMGLVGGIPRRAGLDNYRAILPGPLMDRPHAALPGLWLVGDSVFPGQSVLSVAIGGARAAREILGG